MKYKTITKYIINYGKIYILENNILYEYNYVGSNYNNQRLYSHTIV